MQPTQQIPAELAQEIDRLDAELTHDTLVEDQYTSENKLLVFAISTVNPCQLPAIISAPYISYSLMEKRYQELQWAFDTGKEIFAESGAKAQDTKMHSRSITDQLFKTMQDYLSLENKGVP